MKTPAHKVVFLACSGLALSLAGAKIATAAPPTISGEQKTWHKITLTLDGPEAREGDSDPNPFLDYRMEVVFTPASGAPAYRVPGYFAVDGDAANSSATAGNKWRVHFAPDQPGRWRYVIFFRRGPHVAVDSAVVGEPVAGCDGVHGTFVVAPTDKSGRDFRARGRLEYVGERYLRFAGTGEYFLKVGADAPENLLGYADFDGTRSNRPGDPARPGEAAPPVALKTWAPHVRDWRDGDPTWGNGKGRGLIGALNYLAGTGCNAFSFLTYNAGGDGDDVWPFVERDDPLHFDGSKLDQWQIVFDHATRLGLHLHFKLEETENDDNRVGASDEPGSVPTALDGGDTGVERRLYLRELIARFGHELALDWNLGEENTLSTAQQRAMAKFIRETDAYHHPIVVHTFPDWQERVYRPLLGDPTALTGVSLQNNWDVVHQRVVQWIDESTAAGHPWVVANDEQGPHYTGVPPDPGYESFAGVARPEHGNPAYTPDDIRKYTLWGALLAGGDGVEYYFGYTLPENDLDCEDWRSRDQSWHWGALALGFFSEQQVPFWRMRNADRLVGNPAHDNSRYCLAQPGELYVVYLPNGGTTTLDLRETEGAFSVGWFDPRSGGPLQTGSVTTVQGAEAVGLGSPPSEPDADWVILIRRRDR